jgi:hypothetical protein
MKKNIINTGFKFEDLITTEERAVMYGVANHQKFDKKDINKQLVKARLLSESPITKVTGFC